MMMSLEEKMERIAERAHESLIEKGRRAENIPFERENTAQNPSPNKENIALSAIETIDPYAHLRDKTQMRKENSRWCLVDT